MQDDARARPRLLADAELRARLVRAGHAFDQDLDRAATFLVPEQSRRQHAGIVEDEQVARAQQRRQIGEATILEVSRDRVDDQQPARRTRSQRDLCDQLMRQIKMEIGFVQVRSVGGSESVIIDVRTLPCDDSDHRSRDRSVRLTKKRKSRVTIVAVSVVATVVVVLAILNLRPREKQLTRDIPNASPVDSVQFRNEVSSLLGPRVIAGNRIHDLQNGAEIFPAMLGAIRAAKRTIQFGTYIYWSGEIGESFVEALSERARAGVAVHVLVDGIGGSKMKKESVDTLRAAGAEFEYFHPLRWYTIDRMNNRDHRKLLIVDGRIGFTGGVGIADAWMGNAQRPDQWRDMHFQIEGPVVAQIQAVFEDNWITTTGHVLLGPDYYPVGGPSGDVLAQMFASSPEGGSENMQLMYLLAIAAARSSIDLEAAYFIPGDLVEKALKAALHRGVKIRIVVPGAHIDSEIVHDASEAKWGAMLDAGAQIYRFQPSLFHCKMMIVDRYLSMAGSTNFDDRSFRLNDEANINVYDRPFAEHMTDVFDRDVEHSSEMSAAQWHNRPWTSKLKDKFFSLGSAQM